MRKACANERHERAGVLHRPEAEHRRRVVAVEADAVDDEVALIEPDPQLSFSQALEIRKK